MFFLAILLLVSQLSGILALPLDTRNNRHSNVAKAVKEKEAATTNTTTTAEGAQLDVTGAFGEAIALSGDNQKTDILYTKGVVGQFEVEFQDVDANTLTVTENKTPAGAPAGFALLDTSSYKIALSEGTNNLTLQKVDFVFDITLEAIKAVDISKARLGKLCIDTNTFIVDDALGELEFEDEENEITLTVTNMVGEWGIFIPSAAVIGNEIEDKAGETEVAGAFDEAIATPASNSKTDILFTTNAAGNLKIEVNATSANSVTVNQNKTPVAPPAGFLFVDPTTFQISTASKTDEATDIVKVDYIFSAAVLAAADVKQGVIGKLDTATQQFVTGHAALDAEFEFEAEENEWTLTVKDLNGEWAILIPEVAALKKATTLTL